MLYHSIIKRLFGTFIILFCSLIAFCQYKGFTAVANKSEVQTALSRNALNTQSIASDFTQIKHMKMLQENVTSKGKFYFRKEDKIRIEYTAPFTYLLIMNGGQVLVKDGDKTNKINTRNSKTMQSINKVMLDCMRGTVFNNKDFQVTAFVNNTQYLLEMVPVQASMKGLFSKINVLVDKISYNVVQLTMHENGGDYTDMNFTNTKKNIPLSDAHFSVR